MKLFSTYAGTVESTADPEQLGRLKVRVPLVYGPSTSSEAISISDLPWALPVGLPAGGSSQSGGMVWLPDVGDHVWVRFLDGEPEKPIWEWGMQDTAQASSYPYFRLPTTGYGQNSAGAIVAPAMGMLTRYNHLLQFTPYQSQGITETTDNMQFSVLLASAGNYGFYVKDSSVEDGQIGYVSAKGYRSEIDDSVDASTLFGQNYVSAGSYMFFIGDDFSWTASKSIAFNAYGPTGMFTVTALADVEFITPAFTVVSPMIELGGGASTPNAFVRLTDLQAAVNQIMVTFNAHIHLIDGDPTTPPTIPLVVVPTASLSVFEI